MFVGFISGTHVRCFHNSDQDREAQGQRDEEEVIYGGGSKLPASDGKRIYSYLHILRLLSILCFYAEL